MKLPPKEQGLRVIAGIYKRRRLKSLPGSETRPMLDRVRETLFNVLQGQIEGRVFADLYAGTGAVGIEALSRGAALAIFAESNGSAVELIRSNLRIVGALQSARIHQSPVNKALQNLEADIVFLGPPYQAAKEYEGTLTTLGQTTPGQRGPSLVIAQHDRANPLLEQYGRLSRFRSIAMGRNVLSFFRPPEEPPEDSPPGSDSL
jgi:16S rRNA (guanine(966)-N(2))-methyltransferase RsmD